MTTLPRLKMPHSAMQQYNKILKYFFMPLVIDGWDISPLNLAESMVRAKVIDYDLQQKLKKEMATMKPRPAIYDPDFIAANQVC